MSLTQRLNDRLRGIEREAATTKSTGWYIRLLMEEYDQIQRRLKLIGKKEAKLTEDRKEDFKK